MKLRYLAIVVLVFLLSACLVSADTLVVGGNGGDYADIQSAVDNAGADDAILIMPGTYEGNIIITSPVSIEGSGTETIVGKAIDRFAFSVNSADVSIRDLVCRGNESGIIIEGSDTSIVSRCSFEGSDTALSLSSASNCLVENCNIFSEHTGIMVTNSDSTEITGSMISAPAKGIYLISSENILVRDNLMENCEVGIAGETVNDASIINNTLSGMVGGIVLIASGNCEVHDNKVTDVVQYLQFFTSAGCTADLKSSGGYSNGTEYLTADIISNTVYLFDNFSVTGYNYALTPVREDTSEMSGYLMASDVLNITFIDVSTEKEYVILTANTSIGELEGYDPETYGFYRISSTVKLLSEPTIEEGVVTAFAIIESPDNGKYVLMAKEQSDRTWVLIFLLVLAVIAILIAGTHRMRKQI